MTFDTVLLILPPSIIFLVDELSVLGLAELPARPEFDPRGLQNAGHCKYWLMLAQAHSHLMSELSEAPSQGLRKRLQMFSDQIVSL